jgi:hypothetical protein
MDPKQKNNNNNDKFYERHFELSKQGLGIDNIRHQLITEFKLKNLHSYRAWLSRLVRKDKYESLRQFMKPVNNKHKKEEAVAAG